MATTYYYTVNRKIIGEHTTGQSRLDYIPDALGSVIATMDQTLTVKSTARFKPYGADLATTGTTPYYGFAGNIGSRRTSRPHTDLYNRARHIGSVEGRWTSVDPLWPLTRAYEYAKSRPADRIDPSGLNVCPPSHSYPNPGPPPLGTPTCGEPWNTYIWSYCNNCYYGNSTPTSTCAQQCDQLASEYYAACGKDKTFGPVDPGTPWRPICPGCNVTPQRPWRPPLWPPLFSPPMPPQIRPGPPYRPPAIRPIRGKPPKIYNHGGPCFDADCETEFDVEECKKCARMAGANPTICDDIWQVWHGCHGKDDPEPWLPEIERD